MTTRLLLVRHGLTDKTGPVLTGWTPGIHLNDTGRSQAARLADRLDGIKLSAVYSSPLERCRETVAPTAARAGLRVRANKGVGEVGYGDWTNRPLPALARTKTWPVVQYRPSLAEFPNGETLLEAQQRLVRTLERLRREHTGNILVCSHCDPIKLALAHYAGMHVDLFQRLVIATASLSVVRFGDFGCQVERMNDTGDLEDLKPPPRAGSRKGRRAGKPKGGKPKGGTARRKAPGPTGADEKAAKEMGIS